MRVVNFYGGPGAGKSTMASQLFGYMKGKRLNVEFATEYAKDLTWRKDFERLDDQLHVFAEQAGRLYTLQGQVDWVITDSPLLLSLHYVNLGMKKFRDPKDRYIFTSWMASFKDTVLSTYYMYDNVDFFVERGERAFVQSGRNQTEGEARRIDRDIDRILIGESIDPIRIQSLDQVVEALGIG